MPSKGRTKFITQFFKAQQDEACDILEHKTYQNANAVYDPIHDTCRIKADFLGNAFLSQGPIHAMYEKDIYNERARCNCQDYRFYNKCSHVAALGLLYYDKLDSGEYPVKIIYPKLTDDAITDLVHDFTEELTEGEGSVCLLPYLSYSEQDDDALSVTFKIIGSSDKSYIVRSIKDMLADIQAGSMKSYGKNLSFVHTMNAFSSGTQKIIRFLMSLDDDSDRIERSGSFYMGTYESFSTKPLLNKVIHLKGRYLDEFIDVIQDSEIFWCECNETKNAIPLHILEERPVISASVKKNPHGLTLQVSNVNILTSPRRHYSVDTKKGILRYYPRDNGKYDAFLHYVDVTHGSMQFIAKKDMPAFTRNVLPFLQTETKVDIQGFDPDHYMPKKASFEIYLDAPNNTTITAELFAVYGEKEKYNVLLGIQDENRRDVTAEKKTQHMLAQWFPILEKAGDTKAYYAIYDDDTRSFGFLKDGIPQLQAPSNTSVYISNKLNRMRIISQPHFRIGVSVSGSVLQLDMTADTMSQEEIAEILSKYDPKKKFIKLRNGSFLNIEDSDSLDTMYKLADSLHLKSKDIASGSIEVPKHKALYLDSFENKEELYFDRDDKFASLIDNIKNTDISAYPIPADLKKIMRPYQKEGVQWMSALYENGFGALLADEMGLGKTLQVLAFIKAHQGFGRTLVVCPASLVYNWYAEAQKFTPDMSVKIIAGSINERKEKIAEIGDQDIVITSYDLLKRDIDSYKDMQFACEIIDEAQYIKNAVTQASQAVKSIQSKFKIALTGTPIENRLAELWSIFDYIMPGFFYSYSYFRKTYELPIAKDNDAAAQDEVQRMIRPFVLRRLKKTVLKDLPEKIEEVYYAQAEKEQHELYEARVQHLKHELASGSDAEFNEKRMRVLQELTKLRQLCCHPSLLLENYKGTSAKTELCMDLITRAVESGHKILLFSQFTSMLDILCKKLAENGIAYHLLTGATPKDKRAELVDAFQTDDVPVFCISLKAGGTGLNLTAADIVIHYDPWWNTAVENQASDRAHRIGQKNVVNVYRLIMKDTVEERILQMQEDKADLAGKLLNGEGIASAALSREDLLNLL